MRTEGGLHRWRNDKIVGTHVLYNVLSSVLSLHVNSIPGFGFYKGGKNRDEDKLVGLANACLFNFHLQ